ncbi:TonB-dependent receptor, partial [candidate division KSB1 bacterium]|nr:TonB-dependent receptor [candidate division KSB1 bacterium]NIR69396.1 TonB-dependent receptor [candidate division KSB1 bacterium]NIS22746.1 TonB-dependent receptor [candidate division KSB1 bacterium]NIT69592.1 TonB-dependent receptor [candidate division KSB1 bacterium]NIU23254.1 TonB-dependent receptor [candidate division KSB1 bacterium]
PDSVIASGTSPVGFSKYTNSAFARATGFEVTLQKRLTPGLWGRVSYTYMKAKGTSSTAEDGFNLAVDGVQPPDENIEFPLSWDQRHSLIVDLDYETELLKFNVLYRLFSPLPFTTPGSDVPNNARRSWRNILDLKVKLRTYQFLNGTLNPFFEIRNVLDQKNLINQPDESGVRAYRLFDPINSHFGRRLRVGMTLNF